MEILREDNAALEKKMEEMVVQKEAMLKKQEDLERKSKLLSDHNQLLQKLVQDAQNKEQVPPKVNAAPSKELVQLKKQASTLDKEKAAIKAENDQLRQDKDLLEKDVVNLRHDLERVYRRFKEPKATPLSSVPAADTDMELDRLLDNQSAWEKQQLVVQDLIQQCTSKMQDQHASKRRRLNESLMVQEKMLQDAIQHFQDELHDRQEFDRFEVQVQLEETQAAAAMADSTLQQQAEYSLQKRCDQLASDHQQAHARADELQKALDAASSNVEKLRLEKDQLAQLLDQRTTDVHELHVQLEQLQERLAAKEQYLVAQKEDTLTVLKHKAEDRQQWEACEAKLQQQIQVLEATVSQIQHATQASENMLVVAAAHEETLALLQMEIDARDDQLATTTAHRDALVTECQQLREQLDQLREKRDQSTSDSRTTNQQTLNQEMPPLDEATSGELQAFFLAYYDMAETKHRALLAERDALLAATTDAQQLSQQRHHLSSTLH
ncbi:hypothetical protein B5M09_003996 [Aphanomyces astaci]|uniref:Uncharacterized protein n=1 Tax=Aphanomyces astaci TaxID=112090 RepID=A0A425BYV5_APHAT|nr:hypothetical protein B5M09_003996 [Aphanomyces astaci]